MSSEQTKLNLDCIILAAGGSTRFRGCKLLAELDGESLITRSIGCVEALNPARLLVISGAFHEELSLFKAKSASCFDLLYCQDWHLGMGHSLACGIRHLEGNENPTLVLLADQAVLTSKDLKQLWDSWRASPNQIACAKFADTYGVPAIFPFHFKRSLMECQSDRGAKALLYQHLDSLNAIDLPHAEIDIDTPADLARALSLYQRGRQ